MATQYIIGELCEGYEEPAYYADHVETWKFGMTLMLPAWTLEQPEAYRFDSQEEAQRQADDFSDYSAHKGYGTRYAVYAIA